MTRTTHFLFFWPVEGTISLASYTMLNHKHFDEQARKLALDIRRITARHAKRLKHLYRNAAEQIYEIGYNDKSVEFHVIGPAPADIAAEIWEAYEQLFWQINKNSF